VATPQANPSGNAAAPPGADFGRLSAAVWAKLAEGAAAVMPSAAAAAALAKSRLVKSDIDLLHYARVDAVAAPFRLVTQGICINI
jgi:hypothetical protein